MKQISKIILAVIIIITAAALSELFLTLPSSADPDQDGQVLGIFDIFKRKPKKKATKQVKPAPRVSPSPSAKPPPPSSTPNTKPTPGNPVQKITPSPPKTPERSLGGQAPPPTSQASPPASPPPQHGPTSSGSSELQSVEREISVLYEVKQTIGPDHYKRLNDKLNSLAVAGADAAKIKELREWLETVNPANVTSTAPPTPPPSQSQSCATDDKPVLTADITDFSRIQKITAPGSSSSEGPKGHSFIWTASQRVPVYAPIAAVLDSGSYAADNADSPAQYMLLFQIKENCNFQLRFAHIDEPIAAIKAALPATPKVGDSRGTAAATRVELQAGDLIGYTYGTRQAGNWDFGLYDMSKDGVLAQYGSYGLHKHSVCWVDYYTPEKQGQYRKLLEGPKLVCSF